MAHLLPLPSFAFDWTFFWWSLSVCFVAARNCMQKQVLDHAQSPRSCGRSQQTCESSYFLPSTKYYSSNTLYYKVLLRNTKYCSSTTKYDSVLQSTTPVLLCTTPYYKVLYTPVLQSSTPVLFRTTLYYKVLQNTIPQYYSVLESATKYYSVLKSLTLTLRGATGVTLQHHQILCLPRKVTVMIDPCHIWNVIYNARSNSCHCPTSPNTAPATINNSHDFSSSQMKRYSQCGEQQVSPSNITKYCACHEKSLSWLIFVTYETSDGVLPLHPLRCQVII